MSIKTQFYILELFFEHNKKNKDKANIIDSFFEYAQRKQKMEATELIKEENLNE